MTPQEIRQIVALYRVDLEKRGIPHIRWVSNSRFSLPLGQWSGQRVLLGHCYSMLDEVLFFLERGDIQKALRWLGFVQGCFFAAGFYSVSEMIGGNNSEEPKGAPGRVSDETDEMPQGDDPGFGSIDAVELERLRSPAAREVELPPVGMM